MENRHIETLTWPQVQQLAQELNLEIIQTCSQLTADTTLLDRIPQSFAYRHHFVALKQEPEGPISTVMADPLNVDALQSAQWLLGAPITTAIAPLREIETLISNVYENAGNLGGISQVAHQKTECEKGPLDLRDVVGDSPAIALLNAVLREAIAQGASDIHLEPGEMDARIRYRIDGMLQTKKRFPQSIQKALIARIKVLASLDIAERRRPQDGSFRVCLNSQQLDVRIATMPSAFGERATLRLLDGDALKLKLKDLHLPNSWFSSFQTHLRASQGLILVCGPTGCGKSTTLCTALGELPKEQKNIMSIEDPIEYHVPGISQTAVHPFLGLNFASGLRHLLRQDPDVIFIGELRDQETAQIALRAALTGHLILSTLHAARAPLAIARLFDLGAEPSVVATCLKAILAQRLVRTLCPNCRSERLALPDEARQFQLTPNCTVFDGAGCKDCRGTGYRGRRALFEWLPIDTSLSAHIAEGSSALTQSEGLKRTQPFELHGSHLIQSGASSVAEVQRALGS